MKSLFWIGLPLFLLSLGSTAYVTDRQAPVFRASTMLAVTPNSRIRQSGSDIIRSLDTLDRRSVIATLAKLPTTRQTQEKAAFSLSLLWERLTEYSVKVAVPPDTNIIEIQVEGPDPERCAVWANALARATQAQTEAMYPVYELRELSPASEPEAPFYPNRQRNFAVGTVIGLVLGVGAAYLVNELRSSSQRSSTPYRAYQGYQGNQAYQANQGRQGTRPAEVYPIDAAQKSSDRGSNRAGKVARGSRRW